MSRNWTRVLLGGTLGTLVMTGVGLWMAPLMGLPRMNPADMLAGAMGGNAALGWAGHLMIGLTLAVGYALVSPWLPGPPALRGAVYGVLPWLMAMLVVMPMMGMPVFGGAASMALGSLVGHLVYGATVGGVLGLPDPIAVRKHAAA
jgi:uncharacterized membrane protein YagU involved in acid resistance